ncbi:uncharacterized protein LOC111679053 [Lucilia cuprina]|uniref:uncharacterized protein LOC111679053 n=1 Tax=Lucilia cuprina TaxID=7375 RepID=UPI001F0559FD|nr:uncharacterized protein LOC111679053 [Lucilia cuprina]
MSIATATKQLSQVIHNPNSEQRARALTHNEAQNNRKKSIDPTIDKSQVVEHVTNKVIKSKQLLRQTPVATIEAEEKPKDKKAKSQRQEIEDITVKELENNYSNEPGQDDEGKDYQIYQDGKVNDFFQTEMSEKPNKISDICLVNDHYILVKMPQQENTKTNSNLAEAAARRKEFRALKEHNEQILKQCETDNKKLCRYLRRNRNCVTRIAPINEEPEDLSDSENKPIKTNSKLYCLKMQSCWQNNNDQESETYHTETKIIKTISNSSPVSPCNRQKCLSKPLTPTCHESQNSQNIQTISETILKSSLQHQISIQSYGALKDTEKSNKLEMINSPRRRKCPRFESFYWLLRPFRGKYRKSKPKIQAVVYKTYFVKWTKPPDTLNHGYGVKSSKSSDIEVSVLRRCRSAIF